MIPVKVKEVVLDSEQNPLMLLIDKDETMVLPVGIGFWEAQAIILKLQGHVSPRPLTHDLFISVCRQLRATVEKVVINDIKESTFYAELYLKNADGQEHHIDARPSDAVALALTVGCPVFISAKVAAYTIELSDLVVDSSGSSKYGEPDDESGPHLH